MGEETSDESIPARNGRLNHPEIAIVIGSVDTGIIRMHYSGASEGGTWGKIYDWDWRARERTTAPWT